MSRNLRTFRWIWMVVFILSSRAQNVPRSINYQGRLTDPQGVEVQQHDYSLSFSVYDDPQAGNLIWGPQTRQTAVVKGSFNVLLGPKDDRGNELAGAFGSSNRWVEITVDGNKISPRQQILSAPYAFEAIHSVQADSANRAATSGSADRAANADQAGRATVADRATTSDTANTALNSQKLNGQDWSAVFDSNGKIDGALLKDASIPAIKLVQPPAAGVKFSRISSVDVSSLNFNDVSNLSVNLITTGGPVEISLISSGVFAQGGESYISVTHDSFGPTAYATVGLSIDGGSVVDAQVIADGHDRGEIRVPASSIRFVVEALPAGSHSFKILAHMDQAGTHVSFQNVRLMARVL